MPKNGENRSVLVTGSSSGIGRSTALHLDRRGFRVLAGVRKDSDADEIRLVASDRLEPVHIDVSDPDSIEWCLKSVTDITGGTLHGLVNNAGISVHGPMETVPIEDLRAQMEVNVIGQVAVTQAFLPLLREGCGRTVFVGSVAGRAPAFPFLGPYSASKWALEAVADAMRVELKPWDIRVSMIEPGSIDTRIWEKGFSTFEALVESLPPDTRPIYEPGLQRGLRVTQALERRGRQPIDVARKIEHALTARRPRARYLVGKDAWFRARIERFIPTRLRDRLYRSALGISEGGDSTGA
jgi:NAD(P)-dependent dehydrogenase (short-subunit alcohol dehydrogenase family)